MISAARLKAHFSNLKNITAMGKGINRLAFTASDLEARAYIMELMKAAGLSIRVDAFGNVIGHYEGLDENLPAVMFGSHGDSVPDGGNYDGIVGILGAIETVKSLNEDGIKLLRPLEVVLFMCEESSRFSAATLGSLAMRGKLSLDDLHTLHDKNGNTLFKVLKECKFNPENIKSAVYEKPLHAFLEMHIEQGKVLEHNQKQIGIVTGIAAPTRFIVKLHGNADHSGATPMGMRHDGLCAAAEIILAVEKFASRLDGVPAVGTVGICDVTPDVMNVIPGEVCLGIDVRSISATKKDSVTAKIKEHIEKICARRGIKFNIRPVSKEKPAVMDKKLINMLADICEKENISYQSMPSGAGHDSLHWADYTPTAMLFIPCKDGISHNPLEFAKLEDIVVGTKILEKAIKILGNEK